MVGLIHTARSTSAFYGDIRIAVGNSHETENVGVITHGELILTLGGQETRYGPGDWYHVPARAIHAARFEKETSEIEFWFAPRASEPTTPARRKAG